MNPENRPPPGMNQQAQAIHGKCGSKMSNTKYMQVCEQKMSGRYEHIPENQSSKQTESAKMKPLDIQNFLKQVGHNVGKCPIGINGPQTHPTLHNL